MSSTQFKEEQFVTVVEFARRISLSESTVWRRIRERSIQIWQPGGPRTRVLISVAILDVASAVPTTASAPSPTAKAPPDPHRIPGPLPRWKMR